MMRGFRKPYQKLFSGDTFTTIRPYKHGEEDLVVGREDGIVLFPRTKKALSLGRAVIIGMETIALCEPDLIENLRQYCKPDTPIVQLFTYLWIRRTIVCRSLMGGFYYQAQDDKWVQRARGRQQKLREAGAEL